MTTLIIALPLALPSASTEYRYLSSHDGLTLANHGSATAALLPKLGGDVVLVVPVRALSWHQLVLPKGTPTPRSGNPQRLRAVLSGLLEEQLLDEPEDLHFALGHEAKAEQVVWVAVCDRAWLRACLQVFETKHVSVTRIVPEFCPDLQAGEPATLTISEGLAPAQLVMPGTQGVTVLPLSATSVALLDGSAQAELLAEPAVAALAEQLFKRAVNLQSSEQRWLLAAQSPWNLAQFDFANSDRARSLKRLINGWRSFLTSPQWRAARWSAVGLLAVNLLGLNAWAWAERMAQENQRLAIRAVLSQTFPSVNVIVDAPLQMQRAVTDLLQRSGAASGRDLETVLAQLSSLLPSQQSLNSIEFMAGEARLRFTSNGPKLNPEQTSALLTQLKARGYASRMEGESLILRQEAGL